MRRFDLATAEDSARYLADQEAAARYEADRYDTAEYVRVGGILRDADEVPDLADVVDL